MLLISYRKSQSHRTAAAAAICGAVPTPFHGGSLLQLRCPHRPALPGRPVCPHALEWAGESRALLLNGVKTIHLRHALPAPKVFLRGSLAVGIPAENLGGIENSFYEECKDCAHVYLAPSPSCRFFCCLLFPQMADELPFYLCMCCCIPAIQKIPVLELTPVATVS